MPIEKALSFQNEADFTSRFIVPLLRRLGYSIVAEYHGQREYGKDIVFGEIDRFGEVAYHGLQAKYQDSIGQADSEKLIDDCRQAFRHPFRHPNTGAECRIGTFVVANAGSIADNARDNLFVAANNSEHGGNVRMFDGKALLSLDRWATISRVEEVGETLTGLLLELRFNRTAMTGIGDVLRLHIQGKDVPRPAQRLRLSALLHYIQKPVLANLLDSNVVSRYLLLGERGVNAPLDFMAAPINTVPAVMSTAQGVLANVGELTQVGDALEMAISSILSSLGPLAAL